MTLDVFSFMTTSDALVETVNQERTPMLLAVGMHEAWFVRSMVEALGLVKPFPRC